jgi:hypothetical protein
MPTLATITVNAPTSALSTRAQELALVARALELAALDVRGHGGQKVSGNIVDTGATVIGSYTYSPVATS